MKILTYIILSLMAFYVAAENCDFHGHNIYEDLGCKPITKEGHACPIRYDCNFEVKNNTCNFRGRSVQLYEKLTKEDTNSACSVDCHCEDTDKFTCAELDCPEEMGHSFEPGSDCYHKYEVDECCSTGEYCPSKSGPPFECKVNGETHKEFTKFGVKDTCLSCVCNKGYKGVNEAPFCRRTNCAAEARNSQDIRRYCAPYYSGSSEERVLCCPDEWVCPTKNTKPLPPNPKADSTSDLRCKFGESTLKLGERTMGQYKRFNSDNDLVDAHCECIVPPLLTCREIPKPSEETTKTDWLEIRPIE